MNKRKNLSLTYHNIDGLLYPHLQISNEPEADTKPLGRYGRMALNYLRNHHPQRFLILQMQGNLMKKMGEVEQEVLSKMESLTEQLLRLRPLPQTDDILERTRHLNQIKETAEELILNDIVFKPR
ncbi:TnpV protein [Paenibacillus sp. 79R4]|uniref:TnpV protein n=1 Tax=Paenibacillus sp. 79R4 TaxID=2212847 RepID=UPI0015B89C27|nr:TnpV protein [Paenibacillus sp. 79R4]NWL87807.1 TnpV protein [Paenibacillus sp. 79R4]